MSVGRQAEVSARRAAGRAAPGISRVAGVTSSASHPLHTQQAAGRGQSKHEEGSLPWPAPVAPAQGSCRSTSTTRAAGSPRSSASALHSPMMPAPSTQKSASTSAAAVGEPLLAATTRRPGWCAGRLRQRRRKAADGGGGWRAGLPAWLSRSGAAWLLLRGRGTHCRCASRPGAVLGPILPRRWGPATTLELPYTQRWRRRVRLDRPLLPDS